MKKLLFTSFMLIALFFAACASSEKPAEKIIDTALDIKALKAYACPMHPNLFDKKPGTCPVCKMDLVEIKDKVVDSTYNDRNIDIDKEF